MFGERFPMDPQLLILTVLAAVLFGPALCLRRRTRLIERFRWPIPYFLAAIALSLALRPWPYKAMNDWRELHDELRVGAYVLATLAYASGWWFSGRKIFWVVCLAMTLAIQPIVWQLTTPVYGLIHR